MSDAQATGQALAEGAGRRPAAAALPTSFRIAMRELRSGLQGFGIFLLCLILGVASLAGVRSLSAALDEGLANRGQVILGGDAEFSLVHRQANPQELAFLQAHGSLSEIATMRAMARSVAGDGRALVELKAVDRTYPLFGEVTLEGGEPLHDALAQRNGRWGVVVDPVLLTRLGVAPGDLLQVGELQVEVRQPLAHEPDRLSEGLMFGPRLFLSREALAASGLVQPGSLVTYAYRLKLAGNDGDGALRSLLAEARSGFPDAGWRIKSRENAAPGVQRFVSRLTLFLSLVGLTALFVGGVGIANAVTNFLDARRRNIAILKCVGAPGQSIFQIYLIQVLALAALAIAIGLTIGAAIPIVLAYTLAELLPLPLEPGLHPVALLTAAAFGLLVTLAFAIWPLGRARDLPAQSLFRDAITPARALPRQGYMVSIAVVLGLLAAVALWAFEDRQLTLWYIFGLAAGFVILIGLGKGLTWAAARVPLRNGPIARLAIGNLHRPAAPTVSVVLSLGLGLALFVTLALVDSNLTRELKRNLPGQAPSFFFLDIQPDQHEPFEQMLAAQPGTHDIQSVPMLRGTIVQVNGVPSRQVRADPEVAWVLRGDRGLTYSETPPANSVVTAGEWWPADYSGEPLVSMAEDAARGLGLSVGDALTVNVLGREITARIASLRQVEWRSLAMNFVLVFSPNALRGAPHTFLITVKAPPENEPAILKTMSDAFPNSTAVRVKEALDTVNELMEQLLTAVRGANAVTLLVGVLVLAGALATGLRTRIYDAVVLKTFGARRQQLLSAYALEYGLLGLTTALFAIIAGAAASYAILTFAMQSDWIFSPAVALSTAVLATAVTIAAGLVTTWAALRAKPTPILRNE
ncbi:ABC transporter permease [Rhodoligotrophos defluvii]|uniref:ABC transporter permease n=1 Tax=Rhodoligotrophos defluvii TaxID=2561934 RepID=UPI0010C97B15|nr:FtsX-like permease family protein [Rhodoligotrophos defluvii]